MNIFEFHTGLKPVSHANDNESIDCPFCEKEHKFFYNKESFLWQCKVCQRSGNHVTFVRELYDQFKTATEAQTFLANLRGLPISAFADLKPKYNTMNNSYIVPSYRHGKINNLYKITQVRKQDKKTGEWKDKWIVMNSPGPFKPTVTNWDETTEDTVMVCEGVIWDRAAAKAIIGSNPITPIGIPGAGTWNAEWCEILAEKDVIFAYDNDSAGRQGFEKVIINHIAQSQFKPKSISFLKWPENKPEGYDLNDLYNDEGKGSFGKLKEWIKPYTAPENVVVVKSTIDTVEADMSCDTFDKLLSSFESVYHTTEQMKMALLLVLTSIYSTKVEGEQLWIRLIGAPSSGKTTIAKTVSGSSQVVLKSTFTGLFSGWKDDKGTDNSLVPLIAGKTLIVKDADALMQQGNIQQIMSQLRDFYDKDSSTFYRHGLSHDYRNIRSTMVLCGTRVLRRSDQSFLGERFLDFELELTERDRELIEERMLQRSMAVAMNQSSLPPDTPVIAAAKGFLEHVLARSVSTVLGPREQMNIRMWAKLATQLRTKVDREKYGHRDITFEPVIEVPARLIGQLTKLYMCAPVIFNESKPNEIVHRLVADVTKHIIDTKSLRYRIVKQIARDWKSRDELLYGLLPEEIDPERMNRELQDLMALKLINAAKMNNSSGIGRHVIKFQVVDKLKEGLEHLGID